MSRTPALKARLAHCNGRYAASVAQMEEVLNRLTAAGSRLSLEPAVKELLERLQSRVMSRSVGGLQALLSAILNDVFPGKGDVVLTVSSLRGAPALDIYVDNQGQPEDASEGSGGAVDNVLSAGLRYSALMRTQNRRLMVMDEPDCWMRPDKVPPFVSVLRQVSEEVGIQTLLVSHHDESFFSGSASMVYLEKISGIPVATQLSGAKAWPDNDEPGLRSIRLIGFKAHADTLIPLCPGMNALIGENDLGKSTAFVAALRAVAYGRSDDTCIRHGADKAVIEITLEKGMVVEWTRFRDGSPKVMYRVLDNGVVLHEGRQQDRGTAPEWVEDLLGIREVDGLDIQLRSQKSPVFLLDQPPSRRAQVLSVGREASHLSVLMERYRELVRRDRESQTRDGKLSTKLQASVQLVGDGLQAATDKLTDADRQERAMATAQEKAAACMRASQSVRRLLVAATVVVPGSMAMPKTPNPDLMARSAAGLRRLDTSASATVPDQLVAPVAPDIKLLSGASRRGEVLRKLSLAASVEVPAQLHTLVVPDSARASGISKRLAALQSAAAVIVPAGIQAPDATMSARASILRESETTARAAETEHKELSVSLPAAVSAVEALKEELGLCPTCGKEFEHEHAH